MTYTDDLMLGTIAVPHGWGHARSWQRANRAGGATSNFLADEVEELSASTVLNGIPVRVEPSDVVPPEVDDPVGAVVTSN